MGNTLNKNNKILTADDAQKILQDEKIVFVAGVFDLLHIGHINFLRSAKGLVGQEGKLVVVIHDDESVKAHKGENRPLVNQVNRLDFLSELESVDYVIAWHGWESITKIAEKLNPKYFAVTAKSYDHSNGNKWQGQTWDEVAQKIGAQVVKIETTEGLSTSNFEMILRKLSD